MAETAGPRIVPVRIVDEMRRSYIDYAMSVIVSRALPDVRDGLKPVQRRILYTMGEMGLAPNSRYVKSARVVGEVLGKYHPHGDPAVYDALVRMAQDFTMRHPLVDGQGNYGSVDGDPAAHMRYTECRLMPAAMEMLADLDKDTVDFQPNYDEQEREPVVLPARFPNLLVNGSAGIAVGMATNIPPHNLGEVIDALVMLIDMPDVSLKELMLAIKAPDFPTGGQILGREGIRSAYETGRGILRLRAAARIETLGQGKQRILVTELPYQVVKARLIERIAELVRERKIDGITDLRDESDRTGIRLVIELRRDANANVVLNQLYKHTQLQETFGVIMLALVDGTPQVLDLRGMLAHYLEHQKRVVTRRAAFDLAKATARAHILEGLRIALDHIDRIVALIRAGLMGEFGLSEKQAEAILEMRLQRLVGLEREKIEEECAELQRAIEYLRAVLASERMVYQIVRRELLEVRERYADERRTRIVAGDAGDFEAEDLIPEEDVVITLTHLGYVKRQPVTVYRPQRRGGRGITATGRREEDFVEHLFITTTHHYIMFFTNSGRVYRLKGHEIPEAGRQARGTAIVNLLQLEPGEKITAVIPVRDFEADAYLFLATRRGTVKRTRLAEFENIRRVGLIALYLDEGDELIGVRLTAGDEQVVLATHGGQAVRFRQDEVRPMGRAAHGVKGIDLEEGDYLVAMEVVAPAAELLLVSERGYGKRTPIDGFPVHHRGGKGVKVGITETHGPIAGARLVQPDDEVMLITEQGVMIRTAVRDISVQGRYAQGVILIRLAEGDRLAAMARVEGGDEE